uniref:Uncharacterized protein n=1 Tax=Rhizophora mucronata TaxID=61149 RepID=A0A2P2QU29_RHIMU
MICSQSQALLSFVGLSHFQFFFFLQRKSTLICELHKKICSLPIFFFRK